MTIPSQPADLPTASATDVIPLLTLDLDWGWRRPKPRPRLPKGEPRDDARPVRCVAGDEELSAPADALPFLDGSIDRVDAGTIFSYVRNDDGLAGEIARVLRDGGTVSLRVPSTGPLAGLDALNLFRYLVDVTGRGPRAFELGELGWRRHYAPAEIETMFGRSRFVVRESRRAGIALGEGIRLVGLVGFRWLRPSRDGYRGINRLARAVERRELAWRVPFGFWLTMTLEKTAAASDPEAAAD